VSGAAGTAIRVFRFSSVQGALSDISVGPNLPRQTFNIAFNQGTAPTGGGTVSTSIPAALKAHGIAMTPPPASPAGVPTFPTARHTVANGNWEQIGWNNASQVILNHRQFASTTTANHWTPNGTTTWGAGASVVHADGHTVNWTAAQRTIPASDNQDKQLFPVWAPRQTTVIFTLGALPPGSGEVTGSTPNQRHLTNNAFTFPGATFTVETGAIWEQVGWTRTLDIHARVVRPLETTLPSPGTHTVANGHNIAAGSTVSHDHVLWPGTNVTYYPVWRRVITDGNVNVVFVGAPEGFMDTALSTLDISATMPFEVESGTNQLVHAGTSEAIVLPSFDAMNSIAPSGFTFNGWYIRTAWSPATTRLDNPATPGAEIILTSSVWPPGIFPQLWEPYIWIEARWT